MLYKLALFVHILSVVTWVGGTIFLVFVMAPLSRRRTEPPGMGAVILRQAAKRFVPIAWGAMVVLAVTGVYMAWEHWGVSPGDFFTSGGHFIRTLREKLALLVIVVALSLAHDFVLGPYVSRQMEERPATGGPPPKSAARSLLLVLARVNLLLVLAIIYLAVTLTRP